jgi:hypothetical protein
VLQYWRRALIRIVRYSLVWGCDDGQPDLLHGGHAVCPVAAGAITRRDTGPWWRRARSRLITRWRARLGAASRAAQNGLIWRDVLADTP